MDTSFARTRHFADLSDLPVYALIVSVILCLDIDHVLQFVHIIHFKLLHFRFSHILRVHVFNVSITRLAAESGVSAPFQIEHHGQIEQDDQGNDGGAHNDQMLAREGR